MSKKSLRWIANAGEAATWLAEFPASRTERQQAAAAYPLLVLGLAPSIPDLTRTIDERRPLLPALQAATGLSAPHLRRLRGVRPRFVRDDPVSALEFVEAVRVVFGDHLAAMPSTSADLTAFWKLRRPFTRAFSTPRHQDFWLPHRSFAGWRAACGSRLSSIVDRAQDGYEAMIQMSNGVWSEVDRYALSANMDELRLFHDWWILTALLRIPIGREVRPENLDTPWLPWFAEPIRFGSVTLHELRTARDLIDTGQVMGNCASSYGAACHRNRCRLLVVMDADSKPISLVQIEAPNSRHPDRLDIGQHYGPRNQPPPLHATRAVGTLKRMLRDGRIGVDAAALCEVESAEEFLTLPQYDPDVRAREHLASELRRPRSHRWRLRRR